MLDFGKTLTKSKQIIHLHAQIKINQKNVSNS
jgi:hypothetical protein